MSVDAFKSILRQQVEKICADQGWQYDTEADRGWAFQRWAGDLLIAREGLDADVDDGMFLANDLKIDVVLEDVDRRVLYLIQAKYPSLAQSPPLIEDEVITFFNRHDTFLTQSDWVRQHISDQLLEYISDYKERLESGWTIFFYFVSTGRASNRISERVLADDMAAKQTYPNVSFRLLDISGIKEYYIQAQTLDAPIPEEVKFTFPRNYWITKETPHRTLLGVVKGNTLTSLYKKDRERIFTYNIRSFLGRNQLNREIIETATQRPLDFYYFNNGVSAICTSFHLNEQTGEFRAENFQIINGAQTVGALSTIQALSSDVEVLLRITEGISVKTEKGFNADIIRYNNTQNVVKLSDFRSNDPIHQWLERKFQQLRARGALDRRITYERKRSLQRYPGTYVLILEELAKVRYAFDYEPTRCVAEPKSLWTFKQDGGVYEDAFGVAGEAVTFWPQDLFDHVLVGIIIFKKVEEVINEAVKRDRKFLWLRRLRYFALSLAREHIRVTAQSEQALSESRKSFDEWFDEFWKECRRALIDAYQQAFDIDKTTVFALARSDQRWLHTKSKFKTFLEMSF
jgi:hypothetical protein